MPLEPPKTFFSEAWLWPLFEVPDNCHKSRPNCCKSRLRQHKWGPKCCKSRRPYHHKSKPRRCKLRLDLLQHSSVSIWGGLVSICSNSVSICRLNLWRNEWLSMSKSSMLALDYLFHYLYDKRVQEKNEQSLYIKYL